MRVGRSLLDVHLLVYVLACARVAGRRPLPATILLPNLDLHKGLRKAQRLQSNAATAVLIHTTQYLCIAHLFLFSNINIK